MIKLVRLFSLACLVIISISGCQTVPASSAQKAYEFEPPLGKTSLVLIRPFYIAYGIRGLSVKLNNVPAVELSNKSFTVLHITPGTQKIESEGGFLSWSKKEKSVEAKENQTIYLVWYIEDGLQGQANKIFNAQWVVVSKEVADNYLNGSSYVPPSKSL